MTNTIDNLERQDDLAERLEEKAEADEILAAAFLKSAGLAATNSETSTSRLLRLAAEAVRERDRLREVLETIKGEAERKEGSWLHLKRCISAQARQALEANP